MSEEHRPYYVEGKPQIRSEVYLAARRLVDFCKQFSEMTEEEKKACLERVDEKESGLLVALYRELGEYLG